MTVRNPIRVGMFGGGVVAGGVIEMLASNQNFKFIKICVRDLTKKRDFAIPDGCSLTDKIDEVLQDASLDLLVELMGGVDDAWKVVKFALVEKKPIVTANKALLSKFMGEVETKRGLLGFEAAVCGGIPIISNFKRGLRGDSIQSFSGIMNGTTNFILSEMSGNSELSYSDVLESAQKLGYAESDPSADVEGWDARSKLAILSRIAFGQRVDERVIFCQGITNVCQDDIIFARSLDMKIKLLGYAKVEAGRLYVWVSPCFIPVQSPFWNIHGADNAILSSSKYQGNQFLVGSGAGRYPTATSVVADMLEIGDFVRTSGGVEGCIFGDKEGEIEVSDMFSASFYVRGEKKDSWKLKMESDEFTDSSCTLKEVAEFLGDNPSAVAFPVIY